MQWVFDNEHYCLNFWKSLMNKKKKSPLSRKFILVVELYLYIYIYIWSWNYLPWNFFSRKFMEGRFSFFVKINSRILVFQGIGYKPSPFEVIAISPRFIPKYIFKHLMERSFDYFCRIICNLTLVKLFIFKL